MTMTATNIRLPVEPINVSTAIPVDDFQNGDTTATVGVIVVDAVIDTSVVAIEVVAQPTPRFVSCSVVVSPETHLPFCV